MKMNLFVHSTIMVNIYLFTLFSSEKSEEQYVGLWRSLSCSGVRGAQWPSLSEMAPPTPLPKWGMNETATAFPVVGYWR